MGTGSAAELAGDGRRIYVSRRAGPLGGAGVAVLAGGVLLAVSLFLTWSHQLPDSVRARFAHSPLLIGVPSDPTGWQVYSMADIAYALLAAWLVVLALAGARAARAVRPMRTGRGARLAALIAVALAILFVVHAIAAPPADGVEPLGYPPSSRPHYTPVQPAAGVGETVALAGLLLAGAGLAAGLRVR